jgi:hypothetical protein
MSMSNVVVPAGVGYSVSPGRETTQIGANNTNVQGMLFNLTLPNGSVTSVFVPYAVLTQTDQVAALFNQRVAAINAIAAIPGT